MSGKLLALDTSSLACSVALQLDGQVVERHEEKAREHTRLLTPMIRSVLAEAATSIDQLDAIVLGNGPGSFIGMRIAASVAQGLAHGAGKKIVPVSSLAAVAAQVFAETDAAEVVVAQDAHVSEVYLGAFRRDDSGLPEPMFAERLHGHLPIPEFDSEGASGRVAAGFGWQRYPELLSVNRDIFAMQVDILYPRARFLLPHAGVALQSGQSIDPAHVNPAYLRQKVAEKPSPSGS